MVLDKPGRVIERVKLRPHVGIEGNTRADLLAIEGRLANHVNPSRQWGTQCCEFMVDAHSNRRKVDLGASPTWSGALMAEHAIALLGPLGLEVMSYCPFDVDELSC